MSVQLLLLRKSIYWTWVYCKITKVKTWISFSSHCFAASPFPCPGESSPAWCPLYPVPSWWQPICSQWLLSHRPYLTTYLGSLPQDLSKEKTKSPTWKNKPWRQKIQRGNGPFPPPGFLVVFMTLPWAAVWDGDAGYGQKKEQLKAALVGKPSCELHRSGLLTGKWKSARSK